MFAIHYLYLHSLHSDLHSLNINSRLTWGSDLQWYAVINSDLHSLNINSRLRGGSDLQWSTVIYSDLHSLNINSRPTGGNPNTISGNSIEIGLTACAPLLFYKGCPQTNLAWKEIIEIMQSDYGPRFSFLSCSCRLAADEVLNGNGFLNPLHQLQASSEVLPPPSH